MADLLHNKLLHSLSFKPSRGPSLSFPLNSLSLQPNFCVIRLSTLRHSRLSLSSSVLANLSPDSTKLDIISTSEQADGSLIFKFGDASQISQSVNGAAQSEEVGGVLYDQHNVNTTESEVVGTSDSENVVNSEKKIVADEEKNEVGANDGTEVENSIYGKEDDDHVIEIEDSTESKVDKNDGTELESFTKSSMEHQETVLESDGGSVEDDGNRNSTSAVEIENSNGSEMVKHDEDTNNSSDSIGKLVIENSSDSELVQHGVRVGTLVATSDSSKNLIMESFKKTSDGEAVAAASISQLESNGRVLLEISEKSSRVQASELATSLQGSAGDSNVKHLVDGEDSDNDMIEYDENKSPIQASDMTVSLEDKGLEGNAKNLIDEEDDDNDMVENANTNAPTEASDMTVSLEDKDLMSNEKDVAIEEYGSNRIPETAEKDSCIEASDIAVSLNDDERHISEQLANEKYDNSDTPKTAEIDLHTEASDTAVSLEDDGQDSSVEQVTNKKDGDKDMLETLKANSPVEASDIAVSLEDDERDNGMLVETAETSSAIVDTLVSSDHDEHERNVGKLASKEHGENDMLEIAVTNSTIKDSDRAVSLTDDKHSSNVKGVVNEDDDDKTLQEVSTIYSLEALDKALSLEDDGHDSRVTQAAIEEEDGNGKFQKIADVGSAVAASVVAAVEASDMAVSPQNGELDRNEKHILNEDDVWVELMEKPAPLEGEPTLDEEASCDSHDNVVTWESTFHPNMVHEAIPPAILQSDDNLFGGDSLKAAGPEPSGITLAEAIVNRTDRAESAEPTLFLSSAAASFAHPGEALSGGEDAYFVCPNWFGVADGVGQWSFGGTERGGYVQALMRNCENLATYSQAAELTDVKEVLQEIAMSTESTGSARVLIAHFANQTLHVANVGDTGYVVIRNGAIFKKSTPMVHEFNFPHAIGSSIDPLEVVEEYHIELEVDDVIIAATDGLFDNLYDQEIASIVSTSVGAGLEPRELAQLLVTKAQEVGSLAYGRSPFADAAKAAGHIGVVGGKLDHVTVIVSLVRNQ